ncbi:MAG: cyclic nucleotide-binding and patatin-like phospholipase domain-containing protein [Chloroflexota bacterium]
MLKAIPLFRNLDDDDLDVIAAQLNKVDYPRGSIVFQEGDVGDSMYLVESGQVQVIGQDQDEIIAMMGPGNFVGDLALLLGQPRSAALEVTIDARLWALSKDDFDNLIDTRPTIALEMMRELSRRMVRTARRRRIRIQAHITALYGQDRAFDFALAIHNTIKVPVGLVCLPDVTLPETVQPQAGVIMLNSQEETGASFAEQISHQVEVFQHLVLLLPSSPSQLDIPQKALELADKVVCLGDKPQWLPDMTYKAETWTFDAPAINLSRIARRLTNRVIGLALSSGGARGLAHIGVLKVLEEADVPIDMIAGSSAGAMFGGLHAAGWSYDRILSYIQDLKSVTNIVNWDFNIPPVTGIVKGRRAYRKFLKQPLNNLRFDDLETPLFIIAADILRGEEVVFGHNHPMYPSLPTLNSSIANAIRASVNVPVLPEPWEYNGHFLVDGGLVNPLPASTLRDRGANIVIASSVIQPLSETQIADREKMPSLLQTISHIFGAMEAEIITKQLPLIDVLIQHNVSAKHTFDFDQAETIIQAGEDAAWQLLSVVKQTIDNYGRD